MRLPVLIGLVAGMLLSTATAANAAPRGRILQVTSANGTISVLFSGVDLGDGQIDPASAKLSVDGQVLATRASLVSANPATIHRTAVIAIDTSGSMQGARLAGAKGAADLFLRSLPADVSVGLVTFSSTARLLVGPTTDHGRVQRAVRGLVATGDTALYDATALAVRTAGTSGARTVLLLTDGKDEGSRTSLSATLAAVRQSKALLSAVALGAEAGSAQALVQIAGASGGSLLKTNDAAGLATAFQEAARSISQQVLVTATLPTGFAKSSGTVSVAATANGAALTDQVFTSLSAASSSQPQDFGPRAVDVSDSFFSHSWVLYAATGGLFLGFLVLLTVAALSAPGGASAGVRRRLSIYTLSGRGQAPTAKETTVYGDSAVARSAVEFADRVVARRGLEAELERRLDAGGVPLRPAEWLLLHLGTTLGAALLLYLISGGGLGATLIGLIAGFAGPFVYLVIKESRRTSAFLAQLPDTLQLIAGGLSAGYSLPQALDSVVREGSQPISTEFNRALVESRLGVPVEDALDGIAERMKSEDFGWVVMAIRIQREVGGNLNEILTTVAATLRERERLRRQVKVLSAEGRLSAWILGGLPPVFALYLVLVRPSYIKPLYTDSIGIFLLVVLVVEIIVGGIWLSKVVKVEV
jgi:tight adherence protein B